MATFTFMFLVNDILVWREKQFQEPRTMVHVMHVHFMLFAVFKNLKSSFSEDNMPVHALEIFTKNATKNGLNYLIRHQKMRIKL